MSSREDRAAQREEFRAEKKKKMNEMLVDYSTPIHLFSTGVYACDRALGGGLPFGKFIGWYGEQSTGKTTSALRALGEIKSRS